MYTLRTRIRWRFLFLNTVWAATNNRLSIGIDHIDNAYEKLLAYLEVYHDPMNPTVPGGCPMMNFGMEADDNFPLVKERVNRAIEARQNILKTLLKQGYRTRFLSPTGTTGNLPP
jgi:TetR/AcrR family transcriptional repressor of nem operon